jgi:hypothetical protein
MIKLRYLLVAVIVLALVPWALDWLPSLSCVIPTVDCLDESAASVADENAGRLVLAPDAVLPSPIRTPPQDDVAPIPAAAVEAPPRSVALPDVRNAAVREAPVSAQGVVTFTATRGFGGLVTVQWHVPNEAGFDYYLLDRKLKAAGDDAFELHVAMQAVDGSGAYSWTDTPPTDVYTYRLRALGSADTSGVGKTLGTADVAVEYVVGITVGNFALGAVSGLVAVSWTAAEEAGVVSYALDRKLEGAEGYDLNVEVGYPQGDGTAYSLYDDPHGTGTFVYRLRATLSNGTDRILAEGGVTL